MAAASSAPVLATALFEHTIFIWSTTTGGIITRIDSSLDFGGERLALSADGGTTLVGSYEKRALCCYHTGTARTRWKIQEIGPVQHIEYLAFSESISCGVEPQGCYVINPTTGEIVDSFPKVLWMVEALNSRDRLLVNSSLGLISPGGARINLSRESFAVLSACFGNRKVVLSEAGGHLRCVSTNDGHELWRYKPASGFHVLKVAYIPEYGRFFGIDWAYADGVGGRSLLSWEESTGYMCKIASFPTAPAFTFSHYDKLLYLHDGRGIDVRTGEVVKQLPFEEVMGKAD